MVYTHAVAYNQVIKGTVLDDKSKNTVLYATVYFNGTFNGSIADENGYFDPSGINRKGEMAIQRIADWLPYEYNIELRNFMNKTNSF